VKQDRSIGERTSGNHYCDICRSILKKKDPEKERLELFKGRSAWCGKRGLDHNTKTNQVVTSARRGGVNSSLPERKNGEKKPKGEEKKEDVAKPISHQGSTR